MINLNTLRSPIIAGIVAAVITILFSIIEIIYFKKTTDTTSDIYHYVQNKSTYYYIKNGIFVGILTYLIVYKISKSDQQYSMGGDFTGIQTGKPEF